MEIEKVTWTQKGHKKVLWKVKILWDNGEETWELVHFMREIDPLELAKCAFEKNFMNTNGWKWDKKYKNFAKIFSKLLFRVNATKAKTIGRRNKFKFGVQIPDKFDHVHLLD